MRLPPVHHHQMMGSPQSVGMLASVSAAARVPITDRETSAGVDLGVRTESTSRKASKQPAPVAPWMQPELDFMDHPIEESFARPAVPMQEPTSKRKRGRPQGLKNKKVLVVDAASSSREQLRGHPSKRSEPSGSKIRTDSP